MIMINIAEISIARGDRPTPFNPNSVHYKEVLEGVRANGILVPLLVERKGNGKYKLIDGFSRYHAALACRLTQIPVEVATPKRL